MAYREWEKEKFKSLPRVTTIDLSTARNGTEAIYVEGDRFTIICNDATDLQLAVNEPANFVPIPRIKTGRGSVNYQGYFYCIYLKHSSVPNGKLVIVHGFPESLRTFSVESYDYHEKVTESILRYKLWCGESDWATTKVYSGSPTLSITKDIDLLDYKTTLTYKALCVRIPANSTVELYWEGMFFPVAKMVRITIVVRGDTNILASLGFLTINNDGEIVRTPSYQQSGYLLSSLNNVFTWVQEIFASYTTVCPVLKLQNSTASELKAYVLLVKLQEVEVDVVKDQFFYESNYRTVTETTETVKYSRTIISPFAFQKRDRFMLQLQVYCKVDSGYTLYVNFYLDNRLVYSASTTSTSWIALTKNIVVENRARDHTHSFVVKAYVSGGTGYLFSYSAMVLSEMPKARELAKYLKTNYTGVANGTTTLDVLTWANNHYKLDKVVITTDANVTGAYLKDGITGYQISESLGASTSKTLIDELKDKEIEDLDLVVTSGATAGVVTLEIYYKEVLSMLMR